MADAYKPEYTKLIFNNQNYKTLFLKKGALN